MELAQLLAMMLLAQAGPLTKEPWFLQYGAFGVLVFLIMSAVSGMGLVLWKAILPITGKVIAYLDSAIQTNEKQAEQAIENTLCLKRIEENLGNLSDSQQQNIQICQQIHREITEGT